MSGSRKKFRKSLKYLTNLDIPVSFRCSFPLFKCLLTLMLSCKIRSIKLLCNFIEIALRHGCSLVNLLHIFRTPFSNNTSGRLFLKGPKTINRNTPLRIKSFIVLPKIGIQDWFYTLKSAFLYVQRFFVSSVKDNNYVLKVRPRKRNFRESRVSSFNKITWTLNLEFHMSLNLPLKLCHWCLSYPLNTSKNIWFS